jgi:hypothetical protein
MAALQSVLASQEPAASVAARTKMVETQTPFP